MDWFANKTAKKVETFITVKEGRMCVCTYSQYKEEGEKESLDVSTIVALTKIQAGEVARVIGLYPKEGNRHFISEEEAFRIESYLRSL